MRSILSFFLIILFNPLGSPGQPEADKWVEKTLKGMTLREKVGQMIVVPFSGYFLNRNSQAWKQIEKHILEDKVGGFIMFGGEVYGAAVLIHKMQRLTKIPLLISSDFERGVGNQIARAIPFPTNMAVGATRSEEYAYLQGKITALEARAIGIHQTYAPVVDVNNNPDNPIINVRSYGENPELVAKLGLAFIRGCQDHGLIATAKHFPGHGNTSIDSHIGLPVINVDRESLESIELRAFKQAIDGGVQSIMVGHIAVPNLDPWPGRPASLSMKITTDLLRKELGFKGLIVTDAMVMGGVVQGYTPRAAAVMAVKAGVDMVLMPPNPEDAIDAIVGEVERGAIPEERIDDSVRRILSIKAQLGLHRRRFLSVDAIDELVGSDELYKTAQRVAEESITLVKNEDVLPLALSESTKLLAIALFGDPILSQRIPFLDEIKTRFPWTEIMILDPRIPPEGYNYALEKAEESDIILCGAYVRVKGGKGSVNLLEHQIGFLDSLIHLGRPVAVVSFGSPYLISQFPEVNAYLCAYGWGGVSQEAAVKALFGEIDIKGKLPVTIPSLYPFGHGLELKKRKKPLTFEKKREWGRTLRVGLPEEAGISSQRLKGVYQIINKAIEERAFPGAVILIARRGLILGEGAFGRFTYSKDSPPMRMNTIFDLASLTKVVATTTAIMILYDRGLIDLEAPVVQYLPEFGQRGKGKIKIKHLLAHCSGLPAWKPFYKKSQHPEDLLRMIYEMEPEHEPGTQAVYSDLGFIVLGEVIERITGKTLDRFCREEIFEPLGMRDTMFNPPRSLWHKIAPTEQDSWRGRLLQGEVHDRNAYVMGGVSAHAGLFSTARDLAVFLQMMLNGGVYGDKRIVKESTVKLFVQRQNLVEGSSRALGWDTPSGESTSGHYFSKNSFGHTGFTGTSLWVDPEKELFVIFLTTRVHPTRENRKICKVRPEVHDAVMLSIIEP